MKKVSSRQRRMNDNIRGMFERKPTTLAQYRFAKCIRRKMDEAMIAICRAEAEIPNVTTFSELYETSKSKATQNQQ